MKQTFKIISLFTIILTSSFSYFEPAWAWDDEDFSHAIKITINSGEVNSDLTNFVLLVDLTDSTLQSIAQADGDDISFSNAANTTQLNHEIEDYDSVSGHLIAWVLIPSISSSVDTVIYLHFGNPILGSQENITATWPTRYRGVWHLNDDFLDSTVNNNDGTNFGSSDAVGFIGDGQDFDGVNDYISFGDMGTPFDNLTSTMTISAWANFDDNSTENTILAKYQTTGSERSMRFAHEPPQDIEFSLSHDAPLTWHQIQSNKTSIPNNNYHFIVANQNVTFTAARSAEFFINGSQIASAAASTNDGSWTFIADRSSPLWAGKLEGGVGDTWFMDGTLDELRIMSGISSDAEIDFEFCNQTPEAICHSLTFSAAELKPVAPRQKLPANPRFLTAETISNSSISLTWDPHYVNFTVIGDFGTDTFTGGFAENFSNTIISKNPEFIVTVGDNLQSSDVPVDCTGVDSSDACYGQWYHSYIKDYPGIYGNGSTTHRFFPTPGNHDYDIDINTDYADLNDATLTAFGTSGSSGNRLYYDHVNGTMHFFHLDGGSTLPSTLTNGSVQGQWYKNQAGNSTSIFNIPLIHFPPFTETVWDNPNIDWTWKDWESDILLTGHAHGYERLWHPDGIYYIVAGTAGFGQLFAQSDPVTEGTIIKKQNAQPGYVWGFANDTSVRFDFYRSTTGNIGDETLFDTFYINSTGTATTGYKIERSDCLGGGYSVVNPDTGSTDTTYTDTGLNDDTCYQYRVSAINSFGTGPVSYPAQATTDPTPPVILPSIEEQIGVFSTGLWLLLVVIASVFTFTSMKVVGGARMAFTMLGMALFAGLSIIHASGYEIATYTNSTWIDSASGTIWSNSNYERFIPGGTSASWLSFLFMGFVIFNIVNLFREVIPNTR